MNVHEGPDLQEVLRLHMSFCRKLFKPLLPHSPTSDPALSNGWPQQQLGSEVDWRIGVEDFRVQDRMGRM